MLANRSARGLRQGTDQTDRRLSSAAITLERVSRTYARGRGGRDPGGRGRDAASDGAVAALSELSLSVAHGEIVAVVGPSGCGKTTLLELVCGLQAPNAGLVSAEPAVLMPQRDVLLPWLSALDNAVLALRVRGVGRAAARAEGLPWFERFGLGGFEHARVSELSGGMRQRVSFLRTLLAGKPVLCLDEPFASLDAITRAEMQSWLGRFLSSEAAAPVQSRAHTVLFVTHDVEEAVLLADRVVVMSERPGRVVETLEVALARPRERTDPAVVALRARAIEALGVGS